MLKLKNSQNDQAIAISGMVKLCNLQNFVGVTFLALLK